MPPTDDQSLSGMPVPNLKSVSLLYDNGHSGLTLSSGQLAWGDNDLVYRHKKKTLLTIPVSSVQRTVLTQDSLYVVTDEQKHKFVIQLPLATKIIIFLIAILFPFRGAGTSFALWYFFNKVQEENGDIDSLLDFMETRGVQLSGSTNDADLPVRDQGYKVLFLILGMLLVIPGCFNSFSAHGSFDRSFMGIWSVTGLAGLAFNIKMLRTRSGVGDDHSRKVVLPGSRPWVYACGLAGIGYIALGVLAMVTKTSEFNDPGISGVILIILGLIMLGLSFGLTKVTEKGVNYDKYSAEGLLLLPIAKKS